MLLKGKLGNLFDFNTQAEISIDINLLWKTLKEKGYQLLNPNDSRNTLDKEE